MTLEMLIVGAVRVAGSLPVLRWPFYGALIAILIDQSDLLLIEVLDLGGVGNYQTFDKYLDQVYLAMFMLVAWRWRGVERNVALALYLYRLTGFVLFEVTQTRGLLLYFPNLFEFWFLFIAARRQFGLQAVLPLRFYLADGRLNLGLALVLGGLIALKLFQEYALHDARWLDSFTTLEAFEAALRFLNPFA